MKYRFNIVGAKGLPSKMSNDVYCEFKLYLEDSPNETEHVTSKNPDWNWSKVFTHAPVTDQLLEYLNDEPLIVKVWGKQRIENVSSAQKLLYEREYYPLPEKKNLTMEEARVKSDKMSTCVQVRTSRHYRGSAAAQLFVSHMSSAVLSCATHVLC